MPSSDWPAGIGLGGIFSTDDEEGPSPLQVLSPLADGPVIVGWSKEQTKQASEEEQASKQPPWEDRGLCISSYMIPAPPSLPGGHHL